MDSLALLHPYFEKEIILQLFRSVTGEIIFLKHTISIWVKFFYYWEHMEFPNTFIFCAVHHPHNYSQST